MRIQTKRNMLRAATAAAVLCTAAIVLTPAQASAVEASATGAVNVRSGPGTSYRVLDTLRAGEVVDVLGCRSGWCYVEKDGPDGYVSANYLRRGSSGATFEPEFNLSFNFPSGGGISIGSGGVSIGIGSGPGRPSDDDEVCFFTGANYTGRSFCMEAGDRTARLRASWNDNISSIRNPDRLRVTVCMDTNYRDCRTYTTSTRWLGPLDNEISSIRVR